MKDSKEYWRERTIARLVSSEQKGVNALASILSIYEQAERNILDSINSLYTNYSREGILDLKELSKALTPKEKTQFLLKVKEKARALGINPDEVFDDRYMDRLTRLQSLNDQIKVEMAAVAAQEDNISTKTYTDITRSAYKNMQSDVERNGVTPSFSTLDKSVTEQILRNKWYGGNYSSRIWSNTDELAQRLPSAIGGGIASGASYQKTAQILQEEFGVSKNDATRLVLTESNYFHNQAELQSYVDDGIAEYDFDAVMDGRTSPICRRLNNKRFPVSKAQVGVNYPPMHPRCRSVAAPTLDGEINRPATRAERVARLRVGPTDYQIRKQYTRKVVNDLKSN